MTSASALNRCSSFGGLISTRSSRFGDAYEDGSLHFISKNGLPTKIRDNVCPYWTDHVDIDRHDLVDLSRYTKSSWKLWMNYAADVKLPPSYQTFHSKRRSPSPQQTSITPITPPIAIRFASLPRLHNHPLPPPRLLFPCR